MSDKSLANKNGKTTAICEYQRPYISPDVPDLALGGEIAFNSGFAFWREEGTTPLATDQNIVLNRWVLVEEGSVTLQGVSAALLALAIGIPAMF